MNNDLISRQGLKETIDDITWYHINPHGELTEGAFDDDDAFYKAEDIYNAIDNAPTVSNWGKWVISEISCPNCLGYFQTDCYSTEELNKCPVCGTRLRGGAV